MIIDSGFLSIDFFIIISLILITSSILFFYIKEKTKRITILRSKFNELNGDVIEATKEFDSELNNDFYFSKKTISNWITKWGYLENPVKQFNFLSPKMQSKIIKTIEIRTSYFRLHDLFQNSKKIVKKRNQNFIQNESSKFKKLFDSTEKHPFTKNQRNAIITDEFSNLVVAGAGTGKTSVIVGKVAYLLKKQLATPREILLLAFANQAKSEMAERVSSLFFNAKINIKTFHSLGLEIISQSKGYQPSVSVLSQDSKKLNKFIQTVIGLGSQRNTEEFRVHGLIENNDDIAEKLTKYFVYYLRPYKSEFDFSTHGEYIDYIKNNQIRSLNGDLVKSYEECEIANFLFMNGIGYEYESSYKIKTATIEKRQYKPDFYLTDYGIYLEHFGINRQGETAPYVDTELYLKGMEWKRETHKKNGTKLIETFSYEKTEGNLLSNLEMKLKEHGVVLHQIPKEQIFEKINKMGVVTPFVKLLTQFLNLFKSNDLKICDLRKRANEYSDWKRYSAFLDIFEPIFEAYQKYLEETEEIDFNDMIRLATRALKENKFKPKYKYVLVDEFQDISQSRHNLLKAIIEKNNFCKLLCVGDDWQSIYRFTGSDLSIMTNFTNLHDFSEQMFLDETFRLNNKICELSSSFIMRNENQIPKRLKPVTIFEKPAVSVLWSKRKQNKKNLTELLAKINNKEKTGTTVMILGRYNHLKPAEFERISTSFPKLEIQYHTVHGSKGRESDYVILLGVDSKTLGFPCKIEDDPVLDLVMTEEESYPDAEERRLFYVALSRAKKQVYLFSSSNRPSPFIIELLRKNSDLIVNEDNKHGIYYCPKCKTGLIVEREEHRFYSCNNYPYCDYKPKICPDCSDGFLYSFLDSNYYSCSNENCDFKRKICPKCNTGYLNDRLKDGNHFLVCNNFACKHSEINSEFHKDEKISPKLFINF